VSEHLHQQINLYQPAFRQQKQILSAVTILQTVAVVTVALLTVYAFGYVQVSKLEVEALQIEGLERAKSIQLASVDTTSGPARRAEVERELEILNERLADQQRLVEVLQQQSPGSSVGFSRYLAALARQRHPGVWLTNISVNGAHEALELHGRSFDANRVPDYLAALTQEAALTGQRFDNFAIYRTQDEDVRFHVSSHAAAERSTRVTEALR
jgi:Tfp pilus assembly protein PilN